MTYKLLQVFCIFLSSVLRLEGLTTTESRKYTCRTFGSGVVQPYNGTIYYVRSNCPFTFTRFTHNQVECTVTTRRGDNGLLAQVEIMINKIRTVLQNRTIQVEEHSVHLPFDHKYQQIFHYGIYTKLRSLVLPLSVVWHNVPGGIDTLWVEVEQQRNTDMSGLCGNPSHRTDGNTEKLISDSVLPEETCQIHDPDSITNTDCQTFFSYTLDCLMHLTPDYIRVCEENIFNYEKNQYIRCSFFKEVVKQCGNSSYVWDLWRTITQCKEPTCPGDLVYVEQGEAFVPSCSSHIPEYFLSHDLTSSCVCPNGLVLNDYLEGFQCQKLSGCPCMFGDRAYKPGETRGTKRETCLCNHGKWQCTGPDLPHLCVFEGPFVTTFDGKQYTIGGGCSYVAAQGLNWTIVVEYAENAPSIKSARLELSEKEIYLFSNNKVQFGDEEITELHESEHALVGWQSSMFVQVYTTLELKIQIQVSPEIQLYISPPTNSSYTISGLCGNNNRDTTDDFTTSSGIVENSAQLFSQSWSVGQCQRSSPPTCIITDYEIFADEKCAVLINPTGIFAACHSHIPTDHYHTACIQRTCSCGFPPQQCLCSALSSYVKACTSLGVEVGDWRKVTNCTVECPGNQKFSYNVVSCNSTCRSLSGPDLCCLLDDSPVEGCGCPEGTHLNTGHMCSPKSQCVCHYNGGTTPPGPAVIDGRQCICEDGQLRCSKDCGCTNGKVCVHCSEYQVNTLQKTCDSFTKPLSGSSCESGCYCPYDQYEDHNGNCVPLENCTCSYSGTVYAAGEAVQGHCKTCVCSHGQWLCSDAPCFGKCQVYGNGHYQTFDSKWFRFDGHCQYTLVQDSCGTFSVRVESVPCCDEELTCSRSIILDVKDHFTLTLSDMTVTKLDHGHWLPQDSPLYTVHTVGLYIIVSVPSKGLTLIWDKHTWITVELLDYWRREVCGLCGNFDSNELNDLQTKDSSVILNSVAFGNSWKSTSPPCSDATTETFPCKRNSYCAAWAQRRCLIITGDTFRDCHLKVDPGPYYQACIQESCSCEFEGKFLGFCTAVAAYAEACSDSDICVNWRTPDLCPVYCDYYNKDDDCIWHYEACGRLLTCEKLEKFTHKLEGCYPRCPEDRPYYDENTQNCTLLKSCTCSWNGTVIKGGSTIVIDNKECHCQNGSIKCPLPPPPTTTVIPPTTMTTTPERTSTSEKTPATTTASPTTSTEYSTMSTSVFSTTTTTTTTTPQATTPATTTQSTSASTSTEMTSTTRPSTTTSLLTSTTTTTSTTAPPAGSTSTPTTTNMSPSSEQSTTSVPATTTNWSITSFSTALTTSMPEWPTTSKTMPSSTKHTTESQRTSHRPSATTKVCECIDLKSKQKWQCGESWTEDCFRKSCIDSKLQLTPVQCPESSYPSCPRGQRVKVSDGCCERWTCDCRCELYGDPHYITFEGVNYNFLDECTYVLVEERSIRYNLTIAVDNFFCMSGLRGSCVKGVIVKFRNNTATLNIVQSLFTVQAALNNVNIQPPLEQYGMKFETTGYITTLYLPEIRSSVSLSPSFTLVISLAMENFVNNTQGQCGVCGGASCIRQGGHVEDDTCCDKTAYDWVYPDPQKPECIPTPQNISCGATPSPPPCPSRPLCELLHHLVFAECSKYVDLNLKKTNCDFDSCENPSAGCSSLEQTADECKKAGFLIEWRELTNGSCVVQCPLGLVYKEYSLKMDDFCIGGEKHTGEAFEHYFGGCYCPSGQIRANRYSSTCVDTCGFCKGPLGEPKIGGEVWQSNCHKCTCNNQTVTEECTPIDPGPPPVCGPTQIRVSRCCNIQQCVEKTCSYNGTLYRMGDTWTDYAEPCTSFFCSSEGIQIETKVCQSQSCLEVDRIWDDQHCCYTCNSSCAPVMASLNVTAGHCSSELLIPVCEGLCPSQPRVVLDGVLRVEQSFCQERSSELREVTLQCSDQTNSTYIYQHITSCECSNFRNVQ